MPFRSRSQLRTCYARPKKGWNCSTWLKETPSICNLPERVGSEKKSRTSRTGEKIVGPVITGPRGGKYFVISERDSKGVICEVKVYI